MKYKLFNSDFQEFVIDVKRNAFIPFDPANTDYQEYLQWIAEGNTPEAAD